MYKCPECNEPFGVSNFHTESLCRKCGYVVTILEGKVPGLVKDKVALEKEILEAKSAGKANWYEEPQAPQWHGPYRHHIKKRVNYVEHILEEYSKKINRPLIGLDLGCGDGGNLWWLSKYFSKMFGSDYNITRLSRASLVPDVEQIFMADILNYPVVDNYFDIIFFNHVLEHIPDAERAMQEVHRILKPDGLLVLGVPNEGAFFGQLAYRLQPSSLATTDHVHFFTSKSLTSLCLKSDFKVIEEKALGWGIPHWSLDSRVRGWKFLDDAFEFFGKLFLPNQASSLYFILQKNN